MAYYNLAHALSQADNKVEAIACFRKVVELEPTHA